MLNFVEWLLLSDAIKQLGSCKLVLTINPFQVNSIILEIRRKEVITEYDHCCLGAHSCINPLTYSKIFSKYLSCFRQWTTESKRLGLVREGFLLSQKTNISWLSKLTLVTFKVENFGSICSHGGGQRIHHFCVSQSLYDIRLFSLDSLTMGSIKNTSKKIMTNSSLFPNLL